MPFRYCWNLNHEAFSLQLFRTFKTSTTAGWESSHPWSGSYFWSVLLFLLLHNRVMFGKTKSYMFDKGFYQNTLQWNEAAVLQQNVKQFWLARCKKRLHNSAFSIDDRKNGFYWSWNCHNSFVYFGKFLGVNA